MNVASVKAQAAELVQDARDTLLSLSHQLHANPELSFEEFRSSEAVAYTLEEAGFEVIRGVANLPTAFRASAGSGDLNIAICAEYDALAGAGHACGHNIIAAAAVGAALALQPLADALGIEITVLGTPAEEGGGGKTLMLQRGAFDGVSAALMMHASSIERDAMPTLATGQFTVEFTGLAAHAAAAPHRGRSAAAAIALAQSGIAMMREHLEPGDRVHGIVTNGGEAFNIVPSYTSGKWAVRATTVERQQALQRRVFDIFRGAALMTGCELKITKTAPTYSEVLTDERIAAMWRANAEALGRTSTPTTPDDGPASTDMGNVSYAMPSIHPLVALDSKGANIHEAAFETFAAAETGDRATIDAATMLAFTVIDMASDPVLRSSLIEKPYCVAEVDGDSPYLDNDWNTTVVFPDTGD